MTNDRAAPTVVRERERKFDLDPGRPVPRLSAVEPVVMQRETARIVLDATYFDTDDARLLRAGITLRRRTGGVDDGWHLKLPVSPNVRDEIQLPLAAGDLNVPVELTDRIRGRADPTDLVEIAHLRTDRYQYDLLGTDGARLAILTDDTVAGTVAGEAAHLDGWRELEVELEPGAAPELLDVLSDALTRAGARPAHWPSKLDRLLDEVLPGRGRPDQDVTAGEMVMTYLRDQVDALRRHDIGVRNDEDDAVHQARVAMRRLRSTLNGFGRVLDHERTAGIAEELRWAARVMSDARDGEVLRDLLTSDLAAVNETVDVEGASRVLARRFDNADTRARAAVLDTLNGPRYATLLGSLEALVAEPPFTLRADRPACKELRRAIGRAQRRLAKAVAATSDADAGRDMDARLHKVRRRAKQARYTAELAGPAFGQRVRKWRKAVKGVQATLGNHHDLVEARAFLRRVAAEGATPTPDAFVLGILHQRAEDRAAALHMRFTRQWRKVADPT